MSANAVPLAAEIGLLDQLVKTHRQVHRRGDYFQRVDSVRRAVHVAFDAIRAGQRRPTKGGRPVGVPDRAAALAAVDRALHCIPPAWRLLQHLLAQTYFMPYALVHVAILSRLASLLAAERVLLYGSSATSTAARPPLLYALAGGAIVPAGVGESPISGRAVAAARAEGGAPPAEARTAAAAAGSALEGEDDLGEAVAEDGSAAVQEAECEDDLGEPVVAHVDAPGEAAWAEEELPREDTAAMTEEMGVPAASGVAASDSCALQDLPEEGDEGLGWCVDTTAERVAVTASSPPLATPPDPPSTATPPAPPAEANTHAAPRPAPARAPSRGAQAGGLVGAARPPSTPLLSSPLPASDSTSSLSAPPPPAGSSRLEAVGGAVGEEAPPVGEEAPRGRATKAKRRRGSEGAAPRCAGESSTSASATADEAGREPLSRGEVSKKRRPAAEPPAALVAARRSRAGGGGYAALLALPSLVRRHMGQRRTGRGGGTGSKPRKAGRGA